MSALDPDVILLTGDFTAFPGTETDAWELLRRLSKIAPAYAVRGNTDFSRSIPDLSGSDPVWLLNRTQELEVRGTPMSLTGVDAGSTWRVWELTKSLDRTRLSVCQYN